MEKLKDFAKTAMATTTRTDEDRPTGMQLQYTMKYEPRSGAHSDWTNPKHQVMIRIWAGSGKVKATAFPFAYDMSSQTEEEFKVLLKSEMQSAMEHFERVKSSP